MGNFSNPLIFVLVSRNLPRRSGVPMLVYLIALNFKDVHPLLDSNVKVFIEDTCRRLIDTKRKEVKLLLVSRTIADLEGMKIIRIKDVKEAIILMGLEHPYFRDIF
jgi:hypothetical protein